MEVYRSFLKCKLALPTNISDNCMVHCSYILINVASHSGIPCIQEINKLHTTAKTVLIVWYIPFQTWFFLPLLEILAPRLWNKSWMSSNPLQQQQEALHTSESEDQHKLLTIISWYLMTAYSYTIVFKWYYHGSCTKRCLHVLCTFHWTCVV